MNERDERQFRVMVAAQQGRPCLMCGETANGAGTFLPYDSEGYGAAPGKQRMIVYPLCSRCWETTAPEAREAKLDGWRVA